MKDSLSAAGFIALFGLFIPAGACAEGFLEARFRQEAHGGWAALKEATLNRHGSLTIQAEPIEGFDKSMGGRTEDKFAFSNGEMMLHYTLMPKSSDRAQRDLIYGVNQDYSFRIERPGGEGPWAIGYMGRESERILEKIQSFGSQLFVSHMLDEQDLSWIASQRGFQINSLKPASRSGRDVAELQFTTTSFQNKNYQIRGGKILFDPARYWCILEYDLNLQLDGPAESFGRVEYDEVDGFPAPKHFDYDFKALSPDKKLFHRRKTCDYQYSPGKVDNSVFRLAKYGLPEPGKPSPQGWPTWVGPVAIGIICLGIAAFLRSRVQTKSPSV